MLRLFQKMGLHRFQTKRCLKHYVDQTTRRSLRDFNSLRDHLCDFRRMAARASGSNGNWKSSRRLER
jgi:hypothetical protein